MTGRELWENGTALRAIGCNTILLPGSGFWLERLDLPVLYQKYQRRAMASYRRYQDWSYFGRALC